MKSKKSNAPGCFAGGDITSVASALSSLAGNWAGAFTYQADPTGDPYKIDMVKGLQGGLIGMVPELIKYQKDRKQRAEYVPAATPGRYAMGGDINDNSIPSQQSYTTNARQKAVGKGIESSGRKIWKRGMKEDGSGELTNMQQFLKNKGFYSGDVDGIYGAKTEEAVRKYQKWFNENSTEEMTYTTDGTNAERIGGKGGKRIKVDGIVGDQTRTALMYREMPKQTSNKKPMPENVEFPVGQGVNKFKTTDYTPTDFPDSPMNYAGGLEMLGWALAGMQAGGAGIGLLEGELAGVNAARNLTQQGLQKITTTRPPLNPTVPNPLNGIGGRSFAPKTPSSYGTRIGYAMGGEMDEQLSSRAFEVEANPNKIDSKHYPNLGVKLDHGEVVTDNKFVFSNRIKNPQTGKSFAEDAEKLQKSVGKSEKVMKTNPRDAFANNTIALSNNRTSKLASAQETLATLLGHRESSPKGMATGGYTGGPDDPYAFLVDLSKIKKGFDRMYYDYKGDKFYQKEANTGKMREYHLGVATALLGPELVEAVRQGRIKQENLGVGTNYKPTVTDGKPNMTTMSGTPFGNYPYPTQTPVRNTPPNNSTYQLVTTDARPSMRTATVPPVGSNLDPINPFPVPVEPVPTVPTKPRVGGGKKKPSTGNPKPTTSPLDGQTEYDRAMYEEMKAAADRNLPMPTPPTSVASMTERTLPPAPGTVTSAGIEAASPKGDAIKNIWTAGDALQALEVASKFGQLIGGPDKEMPNFDTTRITKETFDPTNALYQTNRTFQNALNTIDAPSINLRRNIANSLYAQRLGQDNNTRSEYNRMNQSANTAYEQRASYQRRYNIGQTNYTEDLNQRNLDTYRNAVQNAFTSLGNFGEGMNQKRQGTDALNILKKSYPQVYQRIMEAWLQEEQSKTTKS